MIIVAGRRRRPDAECNLRAVARRALQHLQQSMGASATESARAMINGRAR